MTPDSGSGRRTAASNATWFSADTRHLGRFAYSRWALEARLNDDGSGVGARTTWFEVDGRRVPSEWDSEERILRWRPRRAPAKGAHRFTVIATDRAGNERRAGGRFVMQ
jgi:hypothetical protein